MRKTRIQIIIDLKFHLKDLLSDRRERASLISQLLSHGKQAQASALMQKLMKLASTSQPEEEAVIADEFAGIILCNSYTQFGGGFWRMEDALPLLRRANEVEEKINPKNALIGIRILVVAEIIRRVSRRGKRRSSGRANALVGGAKKFLQNCDVLTADQGRMAKLLDCLHWLNDSQCNGRPGQAAEAMTARCCASRDVTVQGILQGDAHHYAAMSAYWKAEEKKIKEKKAARRRSQAAGNK